MSCSWVTNTTVMPVIHQAEYARVGVNDSAVKSGIRLYVWKYLRSSDRTAPIRPMVQMALNARKIRTNCEAKSTLPHTIVPCVIARL